MSPPSPQVGPHLRTEALLGAEAMARLHASNVLVVGLGAVGGACVEALARSGLGRLWLVDADTFEETNLNRQPFATYPDLGRPKAEVTQARLRAIAPTCRTTAECLRVTDDNLPQLLDRAHPDAVVDAIDDLPAKIALLTHCLRRGLPAWSAMGAARKRDPTALRVGDLAETQVCPLARRVRQGLRAADFTHGIRCVWSREPAQPTPPDAPMGSFMPVTATAGLLLAADLLLTLAAKPIITDPPREPAPEQTRPHTA